MLTITTDEDHVESLRRVARSVGRDCAHDQAWKALLFSSLSSSDIAKPGGAFEPVFRYADIDEAVALVPKHHTSSLFTTRVSFLGRRS